MMSRSDFRICLLLTVVVIAVFGQMCGHWFVNVDDNVYVTENQLVQSGLNAVSVKWALTSVHAEFWHPLTWLSYMLDVHLYGPSPVGFLFTNLLFHIANTILMFLVFRRMTGKSVQSGIVAALFAVHPLHVESVVWIAERKDVLSTFFWLLTMLCYAWYAEKKEVKRYSAMVLFFILGLMSKPMLVTLPFVLLLLDYWPLYRFPFSQASGRAEEDKKSSSLALIVEKIPLFILSVVVVIIAFNAQTSSGKLGSMASFPLLGRIENAVVSYTVYLWKMVWPFNLSVFYPYSWDLPFYKVTTSIILLVIITISALRYSRRYPYYITGWLWYLGTLVPVIGIVKIGSFAFADRYTYVPLTGIFIIIVWGITEMTARWKQQKALYIFGMVVLITLMIITFRQVSYWTDSITLHKHAIAVTKHNYWAHNNLGNAYFTSGDYAGAVHHYSESVKQHINPERPLYNLGNTYAAMGEPGKAINYYKRALAIAPRFISAHINMAKVLSTQGRYNEAIDIYEEVLNINQRSVEAHNGLGTVFLAQGRGQEAVVQYRTAIRIDPRCSSAGNNMGLVFLRQGRLDDAVRQFKKVLQNSPGNRKAYMNLNIALSFQSRIKSAAVKLKDALMMDDTGQTDPDKLFNNLLMRKKELNLVLGQFEKALSTQPGFTRAEMNVDNLPSVFSLREEFNDMLPLFIKIVDRHPDAANAYYHISCVLSVQNRTEEAVLWLQEAINKGFGDLELIRIDRDLDNIRVFPYYKKLVNN